MNQQMPQEQLTADESLQLGVLLSILQGAGVSSNAAVLRLAEPARDDDPEAIVRGREVLDACPEQMPLFQRLVASIREAEAAATAAELMEQQAHHDDDDGGGSNVCERPEQLVPTRDLIRAVVQHRVISFRRLLVKRRANPVLHVPDAMPEYDDQELHGGSSLWPRPGQRRTAPGLCAREEFATTCLAPMLDLFAQDPVRFPVETLTPELRMIVRSPEVPIPLVNRIVFEFRVELEYHAGVLATLLERVRHHNKLAASVEDKCWGLESSIVSMLGERTWIVNLEVLD